MDEKISEVENDEILKGITNIAKSVSKQVEGSTLPGIEESEVVDNQASSQFKVCSNNLPAKVGLWTKFKNVMFYEIKVELTPYQQKVEDEINEFLHQEITWKKVHDFLFQEISFGKKNK